MRVMPAFATLRLEAADPAPMFPLPLSVGDGVWLVEDTTVVTTTTLLDVDEVVPEDVDEVVVVEEDEVEDVDEVEVPVDDAEVVDEVPVVDEEVVCEVLDVLDVVVDEVAVVVVVLDPPPTPSHRCPMANSACLWSVGELAQAWSEHWIAVEMKVRSFWLPQTHDVSLPLWQPRLLAEVSTHGWAQAGIGSALASVTSDNSNTSREE